MHGTFSEVISVTVIIILQYALSPTHLGLAAATMYQHARRLDPLLESSPHFVEIANLQLESYLVALNALSLIDPKSAWISLPIPPGIQSQNRKRRKLSKHIPADKYRIDTRDAEVIELADLRHEYTLVKSRLDLVKRDPNLLATSRKWPVLTLAVMPRLTNIIHRTFLDG